VNDSTAFVFAEINEIRKSLQDRSRFRDPEFLAALADRLESSSALDGLPTVTALARDLRAYTPGDRLTRVKAHINGRVDEHVFSLFDVSYFPKLSLDYLTYDLLPTDPHLAERYASNTLPVNITGSTEGFQSRVAVALFPENHLDGLQDPDDMIFYFINKFVERHNRITRKLISEVMEPASFPRIQGAPDDEIQAASAWWVRLHEFHHRQGDMPIPQYLSAKKSKPLAGLEELRVDVSGMLACVHDTLLPREQSEAAFEFILAERLLRYAVEGIPRPNYDAVASQLLFRYLQGHDGIRLAGRRIRLSPDIAPILAKFLDEIKSIEARIHEQPVKDVRAALLAFTNQYTDFDEEIGDYRHIPFFAEVKASLAV
jgi:Family of unknown function (DUF6421)